MRLRNFITILTITLFCNGILYAQPWLYSYRKNFKSADDAVLSFKEKQVAFNNYWNNKEIPKGKGYKPFRRWENIVGPRLGVDDKGLNSLELWKSISTPVITPPIDTVEWKFTGPAETPYYIETNSLTGNGRLNCIAFHPVDSNIIYVGAPSGGFWVSNNQGQTWTSTTDMLDAIGISDIVVSHANPSTIYIATGDGDAGDTYAIGILKSTDGGLTWQPTALSLDVSQNIYFRRIIMDPTNANIMLATSSNGIYRTTNGWQTYSLVQSGNFKDLEFKPGDPAYVYATSYSSSGNAKFYRSTNKGVSFTLITAGLNFNDKVERIELAVTKANSNIIYALTSDAENSGLFALYKSSNSGTSWSLMLDNQSENLLGWTADGSDVGGQGWYDLSLAISPTNANIILVGGVNIWKSTNGGSTWSLASIWYYSQSHKYVHADQHMFAFSPFSNTFYTANDGGLYRSYDYGKNWKDISSDLQILQVYRLGTSKTNSGKLICGNQDNGTFILNSNDWFQVLGGDGMECIVDPVNDDIIYGSTQNGSLYKTTDGGLNFVSIKPESGITGAWVTPFVLSRLNPSVIFAAYKDIYQSPDAGETWNKISTNLSTVAFTSLAVAPSNDDYIYASTLTKIYKTQNGGKNWYDITSGLPSSLAVTSIAISPNDPNKIWITLSGYNSNEKVYYSSNGGNTWSNYSTGLPNLPVNNLVIRYNSNHEMYAATDNGVYYRNASMTEWINYSNGLPKVIVNELEISEPDNKLYAATYGRGIWKAALPEAIPSKAAFKSNIIKGCTDAPYILTYSGGTAFDSLEWITNSSDIIYNSDNKDTLIVSFGTVGRKTIQLKHYLNDTITSEIKYEYLDVKSSLDINLNPDKYFLCDTTSLNIYMPEGYEFSWDPLTYVDTIKSNMIVLKPLSDISYISTISHGSCESTDTIPVTFMPDNACTSMQLSLGTYGIFSNNCASIEINEPFPTTGSGLNNGCISQDGWCEGEDRLDNSLWFKIIVPDSGRLRIRVRGFDSQIALYKADSCNGLFTQNYTLIAANDDISTSNYNSEINVITGLSPGDTLFLQVDGSYGGISGEFFIDIAEGPSAIYEHPSDPVSNIKIYPNPATSELNLQMLVPDYNVVYIDFINGSGRVELRKSSENKTSFYNDIINVESLKGFYIIRITTGKNVFYKKVLIE